MVAVHSAESPLDTAAETVGEDAVEAFKSLANSYRLAILLALWEATDPGPPMNEGAPPTLTFTELSERVGIRDTGQFTYHLDMLVGSFVESTGTGYRLTPPGQWILGGMFAGTLVDHPVLEDEPIDAVCLNCGAQRVMDYSDGILVERCPDCPGIWHMPEEPPGLIVKVYRPPVGLANRTPREFQRHGTAWDRHRGHLMMEGVCPDCSGTVDATVHVCPDHDTSEQSLCERCGTIFEAQVYFVCDVCKNTYICPAYRVCFPEMAVKAFFYRHGLDLESLIDESAWDVLHDAIAEVDVRETDPLEVAVAVELDGDRLEATLDDDATVVEISESA